MELKHFSKTTISGLRIINPHIVDVTKKIVVVIGCPGLSNRLDDVVNNIVMAHACHRVDDRNYYNTEFGLQTYCFDDSHPMDQISLVKTLVEEMRNDSLAPNVFVYTNSPFVLKAFFNFNGRPASDIAFYKCGFNETGRDILLTDVSADTRAVFAHMTDAMNSIMDGTEVFSKKYDDELRRPKFIRFTKEIDYWVEMVELNGKIYDQMDDDAAWNNLRKDFPSLVNDKDEIELLINIETGHIENWPDGKTGDFRTVKIVDTGHYELLDVAQRKLRVLDGYVPEFLSIEDKGYGDYLEFEVDAKGYIKNWKFGDDELKETEKWDEWDDCVEKQCEQKALTLEQAANIFLDALSNSPYNNKPVTDAQTITKQLLLFFQNSASYNPDALVANEQKPAWSEEDEKYLDAIEKLIMGSRHTGYNGVSRKDAVDWLKSLRPQNKWKPSAEQKPAWGEDDEEKRKNCIYYLEKARKYFKQDEDLIYEDKWLTKCIDWINFLKDRYSYKPSAEQIKVLDEAIAICSERYYGTAYRLDNLRQDLKKLRNSYESKRIDG